ncbi:alpha amylase C-terminal domain-containing protein [Adhaeribacter pallidiroseus]|uniref:1,4-alpha-glucan branching enzyme n=1 Tax=Adhaeribacter pallidiroseus TaxID=2072847 RepID=A0A369QIN4_9BACT|nr:alpha amylase C-terminal domain-containing protein [Adhaeribacter pallidiroseus]RDC64783.1 1,4-alpha-glucan branching enzyme [Adhaeribacter pallidiroseus]
MEEIENTPQLVKDDGWLSPFAPDIIERQNQFNLTLEQIQQQYGSLRHFANQHQYLGINYDAKNEGWWYREWAPAARQLFLIGDFNDWNRQSHSLQKNAQGIWEIFLPDQEYASRFGHQTKVKVHVDAANGRLDRIPPYIRRAVQDPVSYDFAGQVWLPEEPFIWTDEAFAVSTITEPVIYECHVGMAQEKEGVGTYREFADEILPRIARGGYNCLQLMAVMEHPYYGSFGYHVSNFFSPTSRFGSPEDLKYLVNEAHQLGMAVIMDVVHSHAVKNVAEGLANFDGSDDQYFHSGPQGFHPGWDSRLFNYGKPEVRQFLLSNLKYWLEEFHFDGFRFDGVTSMLYLHHGEGVAFDNYSKYFQEGVDNDAILYLQLATSLVQEVKPGAICIAEDMSGMPGLCRPIDHGGVGFDYRLGMGIPDYWIKLLKHTRDEDWNIYEMWGVLTNRRYLEKTIAYAESHDQALVGDKTLAFWLMDKEMYFHMSVDDPNLVIDRGIALHKLIRLITISLGGEGYLNFIGNEFGHPEWVDFPREGNNWSHKHARRQWSLIDNPNLKYKFMGNFDRAMIKTILQNHVLAAPQAQQLNMDTANNIIAFERANLIFVFNFSIQNSLFGYTFTVPQPGTYQLILTSDEADFGGFNRIDTSIEYFTYEEEGVSKLRIYSTNRTALVFKKK